MRILANEDVFVLFGMVKKSAMDTHMMATFILVMMCVHHGIHSVCDNHQAQVLCCIHYTVSLYHSFIAAICRTSRGELVINYFSRSSPDNFFKTAQGRLSD